ncbi:hypothetical protein KSP35_04555 [Aquihabitans sp. G128]|uniref:hypothetical protein n=1 Tax=Aquihabitans sp. G128 TaxID=2849779 RepID=UPI001C2395A4|nr:hypothetical protein [Aquihabitans sp. G128]QXC62087.1 hypothetical protein KSP35_04555 [Aquihabitans sp. G128]
MTTFSGFPGTSDIRNTVKNVTTTNTTASCKSFRPRINMCIPPVDRRRAGAAG